MKENLVEIKQMLKSKDKDCVYMAVTMLRNSGNLFSSEDKIKLLSKVSLFDKIKSYSDVCKELDEPELTIKDFGFLPKDQRKKQLNYHKIQNIEKLFNFGWKINWRNQSQEKYYPYFTIGSGGGLVFLGSNCRNGSSHGAVAFYKDRETSDFVGKLFIDIYNNLK